MQELMYKRKWAVVDVSRSLGIKPAFEASVILATNLTSLEEQVQFPQLPSHTVAFQRLYVRKQLIILLSG